MYVIIPYEKFNIEDLCFNKKIKKNKKYVKIVYKMEKSIVNDIYIHFGKVKCVDDLQDSIIKKNKYSVGFYCSNKIMNTIRSIEKNCSDYINSSMNINLNRSICDKYHNNKINIDLYKDMYNGFTIYDIDKGKYDLQKLQMDKSVNLVMAFNYIWINEYNAGISWRLVALGD